MKMTTDIAARLEKINERYKRNKELQAAIATYVKSNDLYLSSDARFHPSIDCCMVYMEDKPVLVVGSLPLSQYRIEETEYTRQIMTTKKPLAV